MSENIDFNSEHFLEILKSRFEKNNRGCADMQWQMIHNRLVDQPEKVRAIYHMEQTGGLPELVCYNRGTNIFTFMDCSPETPTGRRSLCYDQAALDSRKEAKPNNSVLEFAKNLNIELLNEEEYRFLQSLGEFDIQTSSWIYTPNEIRKLGGALFCDRRYNHVFTYHNGASSYYAARGFRAKVVV